MRAKTKQGELPEEAPQAKADDHNATPASGLQARIRQRAYELSQQRDGNGGDALSDWHQAEAEIRAASGAPELNKLSHTKTRAGNRRLTTWNF